MPSREFHSTKAIDRIQLRGVRQHNLKNIDVEIPHGQLTVITGPSGSGKSSLAFHTLYAEGQRRYVETFSPYMRQFFDRMDKPEVDSIDGILPAIAVEQRNLVRTTRSTVGTLTEINDYLKLLFARHAVGYDPETGAEIRPDTVESSLAWALAHWPAQTVLVLFPLVIPPHTTASELAMLLTQQGYLRVLVGSDVRRCEQLNDQELEVHRHKMWVVQDRVACRRSHRFSEAIEAACRMGKGQWAIAETTSGATVKQCFSQDWINPQTGFQLCEPKASLFSFNSPHGACRQCRGFGRVIGIDLEKAIPDPTKSIAEGCIKPFLGERGEECQRDLLRCCKLRGLNVKRPWRQLSPAEQQWVKYGEGGDPEEAWRDGVWYGIKGFFDWLETKTYQMHVRVFLSRYRSYTECPSCRGRRLCAEALCFRVRGKSLPELWQMEVGALRDWLQEHGNKVSTEDAALRELLSRLGYLVEVGLGYLTLDRQTRTLSGGELARVNLTTCLGAALSHTLFVLDEPTVGLHPHDVSRLIGVMQQLRDKGNTLVVVEHEHAVMQAADHILDLGPLAGEQGGELLYQGPPWSLKGKVAADAMKGTLPWLRGLRRIEPPSHRRGDSENCLRVLGAHVHHLKNVDVEIPLRRFVCLSGLSGSGKTTLAHQVIYRQACLQLGKEWEDEGVAVHVAEMRGCEWLDDVQLVDQTALSRTSRSTPAVYCGAFDGIRQLLAESDHAKAQGIQAGFFSFNTGEGRCDRCGGAGFEKIDMQFLSDLQVRCPDCDGRRFRASALQFLWRGRSIAEMLEMTVTEACHWFEQQLQHVSRRQKGVVEKVLQALRPLMRVGLGYLRLGQPLQTLSGGEAQRLKLSQLLPASQETRKERTSLLILDEPTTGLHFADVELLIHVFQQLVDAGYSLLVIEHHLDVLAAADWIIEMGPGPGVRGGQVIAVGTPEQVMATGTLTGDYLSGKMLSQAVKSTVESRRSARMKKGAVACIELAGARHHQLKNINLSIPRDQFVVISGLSGSGKSTLAFDLLFAEGQRRFLDSMSAYARQFANQLEKPDFDSLTGLPPTVAIEQRVSQGGRKSTVATLTEIWNFVRLLYAKLGVRYCCGQPVVKQSQAAMEKTLRSWLKAGPIRVFAPLVKGRKGYHQDVISAVQSQGFEWLRVDRVLYRCAEVPKLERYVEHDIEVLIADLEVDAPEIEAVLSRALEMGKGSIRVQMSDQSWHVLSLHAVCENCQRSYEDLDPRHFSFHSSWGCCEKCRGYGEHTQREFKLDLSRYDSVLQAEIEAEKMIERADDETMVPCAACHGTRLNADAAAVQLFATSIATLSQMSIAEAWEWTKNLQWPSPREELIARDIVPEIQQRLKFLSGVGLSYLQLHRSARTLSGGESQRIRLASQLGSNLQGVLYVLDEPTIGLHPRDNQALLSTLRALQQAGNSLIVVEHDEDTIAQSDWLIDLGPGAGRLGGEVVYAGVPPSAGSESLKRWEKGISPTLRVMAAAVSVGRERRKAIAASSNFLQLKGCRANNLQNIDVAIPLGCLTVVTGVSGSGKSSLVYSCLAKVEPKRGKHPHVREVIGAECIAQVHHVDQSPIGKTSRSCPATFVGVFDAMRKLFAGVPEARVRGFDASRFSFNTEGGRCEECKGNGRIKLEMDFLPATWVCCESCQGKRYQASVLEVTYNGLSIADVLELSIADAADFFAAHTRLAHSLRLLSDMGLGYLTLGQPSPTLSGGEAQRLKLVAEIAKGRVDMKRMSNRASAQQRNLYLIEEPSVGLHTEDVQRLIDVLHRLVDEGHTAVVIEHHMLVAAAADWVIDLGPEAGELGGNVVAQGVPEEVAGVAHSRTAPFLAAELRKHHAT